jgi:hypothetical protein
MSKVEETAKTNLLEKIVTLQDKVDEVKFNINIYYVMANIFAGGCFFFSLFYI